MKSHRHLGERGPRDLPPPQRELEQVNQSLLYTLDRVRVLISPVVALIKGGKTTEGNPLGGSVNIIACCCGSLVGGGMSGDGGKRCSYLKCERPTDSSQFYQIEEGKTSGGQDWSSIAGSVLCQACYLRFYRRGTLERAEDKPLAGSARRCTYDHCDSPTHSSCFFHIEEGKTSGGQDWSSVAGSVLCKACYNRFYKRGTLEPSAAHAHKRQKTANKMPDKPLSTPLKTSRSTHRGDRPQKDGLDHGLWSFWRHISISLLTPLASIVLF